MLVIDIRSTLHSRFLGSFKTKDPSHSSQSTQTPKFSLQCLFDRVCANHTDFLTTFFAAGVGGLGGGLIHPGEYASAGQYFEYFHYSAT